MVLVLKMTSLAIWFIIMLFIIGAAFRRKRTPLRSFTRHPHSHAISRSASKSDHQQSG
ncbi:MAG: hypothetical protein ABRQ24_02855 [Syntrophomonadaceae bacterium]